MSGKATGDILVVDDVLANLKMLCEILGQAGYEVRAAPSGPLALRTAKAQSPDLILLDVGMPDMDGFEVCRRLKASPHSRDVPVIFISASGEPVKKVIGFEAGGVDYITKPFDPAEVLARVRTHLAISKMRVTLERQNAELAQLNRRAQQEIARRQRSEAALRSALELTPIMHTVSAEELMQHALEEGERLTGSKIAFFHFVNPDQETIRLKTWSKATLQRCSVAEPDVDYPIAKAGVWGDCIRQRCPVIHNDYASLTAKKGMPDGHVPVVRELAVPIFERGKIVAVIGVGNKETDYDQLDVEQLRLLAENTWVMIQRKRAEEGLKEAHDELRRLNADLEERVRLRTAELQTANRELEISEERYRRITSAITDYIYTVRIEAGQPVETTHKEACLAVTGYSPDEFAADPYLWFRMIVEEDRDRVEDQASRALSGSDLQPIVHRLRRKDGVVRWVASEIVPHYGPDGQLISYDGLIRDITEQRSAEERVRLLLESTAEAIYGLDLEGNCVLCNPACLRMLGYEDTEQLLGKNMHDLMHHTRPDGTPYPLAECRIYESFRRGEGTHVDDEVLWRADGTSFAAEYWSYPIWREGDVVGSVVTFLDITARKEAEEALRQSEQRFRALTEKSSDITAILDENQVYTYVSPSMTQMLGHRVEEILGTRLDKNVHPDDMPLANEVLRRATTQAGRSVAIPDLRMRGREDRWFHLEGVATSMFDVLGIKGIVVNLRDVTERTLAEQSLALQWKIDAALAELSRSLLTEVSIEEISGLVLQHAQRLTDSPHGFVGYIDPRTGHQICPTLTRGIWESCEVEGKTIEFAEFTGLWGWVLQHRQALLTNMPSQDPRSPSPPPGHLPIDRFLSAPALAGDELMGQVALANAGREYTPFDLHVVRRLADLYALAVQRQRGQERLRKLFRAVEQSANSVIITDVAGNIEYVNPQFTEVTGYAVEEVLGQNPRLLKSGRQSPQFYEELWAAILAGNDWHGELCNKRKNGELYWERAAISPIRDEQGAITHFVAVKEDISERKRLQEQLLQSQKMEAVGQLAGGIAHDFNNLLTIIVGATGLMRDTLEQSMMPEGRLQEDLTLIEDASRQAASLTRQLLTFSRQEVVKPEILDANQVLADVERMLRRLIRENIVLQLTYGPRLRHVCADIRQIEQIILNLATNASDAMPNGGSLTVETANATLDEQSLSGYANARAGQHVRLSFTDTGCGMDERVCQRIFEPFFTTKPLGKGTGLGLATVHGIVTQLGGCIAVRSEVGRGTTFDVYVPAEDAGRAAAVDDRSRAGPQPGRETILLCEDDPNVRQLVSRELRASGYTVLATENAEEALEVHAGHSGSVQLLMTDVILPGMSGRELADCLTAQSPRTRVLYMSGYTADVTASQGVASDGTDFLEKPFDIKGLTQCVRRALDREQRR